MGCPWDGMMNVGGVILLEEKAVRHFLGRGEIESAVLALEALIWITADKSSVQLPCHRDEEWFDHVIMYFCL